MIEWKEYTLGNISSMRYGKMPNKELISDSGYPIFTGYQVVGFYPECNCKEKQIVIVARGVGGTGDVKLSPPKCYVTNLSIIVELDTNIVDKKYFYYKYQKRNLKYLDSGSAQSQITIDSLRSLSVYLPELSKQKKIVGILSALDYKIDLLRRQNETLEAIAHTLFKRWFVGFEFPNKEGQPYKSSGGKMVSSELGEIPDGWRVGKIKDFGNVVCGKTPSKAIIEYFNGDIPFIKIPDMHGAVFVIDTEDTLSEKGANSQQTKFLPVYSINVSCIATVGLVTINSKASHTNQQINSIIPINEFYLEYLFFSLKSLSNYLKSLGSGGSATLNVNTNTFSNIDLLIPQKTAIKNYHNQVSAIFKKIELNAYSIINLQKIRDSLLPKLMSGQIRVTG